jgi:superfamily II RNA helicase
MKFCDEKYENNKYNDVFSKWSFELSDFQKYAIESIIRGNNTLITASTGCGKTLAADFAIQYYAKKGKKIIYTSPIKALSNEKMMTLSEKNPGISFGLLTGDKKYNPDATVLVMTTEILTNTLFKKKTKEKTILDFEMDFEKELGIVIFDEIHYINDEFRGGVWEMAIMMLPETIKLLGLSATIDREEEFAMWIESIRGETWLCPTRTRIVPLEHNSLVFYPESTIKKLKGMDMDKILSVNGKPEIVKNEVVKFDEKTHYERLKKMKILNNERINETFILNKTVEYLKNNEKLPCLCFIFSRNKTHELANRITIPLFEKDSKIPHIIAKECKQLIIKKIPNHKEFINTNEYRKMIKLLEKGIAIHHSGIISIFREVIEIFIGKGYVKLLFATETFAIGLNMPMRTILFPSLRKYDGKRFRLLKAHEYTQMSGRAGRRGIDTRGYIYHLMNLICKDKEMKPQEYRELLSGRAEILTSKLRISFNLLLKLISMDYDILDFMKKSMLSKDMRLKLNSLISQKREMETITQVYEQKIDFNLQKKMERKLIENECERIWNNTKKSNSNELNEGEMENYSKWKENKLYEKDLNDKIDNISNLILATINKSKKLLYDEGFIIKESEKTLLTQKGKLAFNLHEIHCLAIAEFMEGNMITKENLTPNQIASILSIFTDVRIKDENKIYNIKEVNCTKGVRNTVSEISRLYEKYYDKESKYETEFIDNYDLHYDMIELIERWTYAENEEECTKILHDAEYWEIYSGTFIKAVFKINNIATEMEKVYEENENISMKEKMRKIQYMISKSIAVNQSLYI